MSGLLSARPVRAYRFNAGCNLLALTLIALALLGCGAKGPRPLSIKMYHPEKKTTLDCKARDLGMADPNMLADSVETCARQLEKSGFVRQSSEPSGATQP
jgi:predicted small lipoprotein YifL